MAKRYHHAFPLGLDVCEANFSSQMGHWAFGALCEMNEIIVASRDSIATSRALMAEADRLLGAVGG